MNVVTGTDTSTSSGGIDRLLVGIRHLTTLANDAGSVDALFRMLAGELLSVPGADEVHIHHLAVGPDDHDDLVAVYMFGGSGRLSYLQPRAERPPGVGWVASTRTSFLAADADALAASLPRLVEAGTATSAFLAEAGTVTSALLLALAERGEVEAVVVLVRREAEAFSAPEVDLAAALVEQGATALALARARAEAGTDAVTGCMNHRAMRRRLDEEIGRAARTGGPLSALLIDLDDFKLVNDRHGHQAGDALLRSVVHALVGEFRAFDRVARYGGDEFVVILPNAELDSAAAAATRALERMQAIPGYDGDGDGVSASIGVAQWRAPMSTDELLEACDVALLRSKRQGKRRVTRAS
ncbi:MAG TPA: GGDEF domain-containing protein [Solirubrobacteraceae bacterium]|jgi:diguanylate cyclase (GGDEF)-like protein|nr:GGDEF domain-containing protein [Solirubrobacteraceae bacterium]